MTFRAVVRDGMININTHGELPDGTVVEVLPVDKSPSRRNGRSGSTSRSKAGSKKAKSGRSVKSSRKTPDPLDGLIGIWKDRPDWKGKSTLEIAAELREKALGRRRNG